MNDDGTPETGQAKGEVSKEDQEVIGEAKKRLEIAIASEGDNHREAMDDLRVLKGDQWPEKQRRQRESEGRPCLTVNKLPTFLQQVTNDQRQNRASIKVSAVGLQSEAKTATLIQGAIRHMEYKSSADAAYDTAVNSAAAIGFGYFRLKTDYVSEDSFDQEILVKRIRNPFTVYFDPASVESDGSDAQWVLISEKMSKSEFSARYPDAQQTIQGLGLTRPGDGTNKNWVFSDQVRVAEYYRVMFKQATLYKLGDGTTTFETPPAGVQVVAKRQSVRCTVMWYLLTPYEILETTEIKCKWIPVFPVYGTEIDVDGKVFRAGLIRNAKDPQIMYNFWMTSATEEVSMRPKTPYIGAEGQFEGHEKKWQNANSRTFPYMEYKPVTVDGQLAPPPSRQAMADVPVGILSMAAHASDNIKQTTGLFDSSLGASGNATSGKQEIAQQKQGNVTNAHYMDNFFRSLRHAGRCIIDMLPHYYDSERMIRCMGEDGVISAEVINKWDEVAQRFINDVTVGEYDVAVIPGPSYATMRAEAADAMIQFGQSWPKLMDIAGDKVVKAMNWPGAEEIAERIERTIPAEIKNDPADGKPALPPEAQQQIAQLKQQLQQVQEEADKNKASVEREHIKAEAMVEVAHLTSESRKDVAELGGLVKLLLAKMPPPPGLSADVASEFGGSGQESSQPAPQMMAPPPPPEPVAPPPGPAYPDPGMNGDPGMIPGN